jgi:hypothetical protein
MMTISLFFLEFLLEMILLVLTRNSLFLTMWFMDCLVSCFLSSVMRILDLIIC